MATTNDWQGRKSIVIGNLVIAIVALVASVLALTPTLFNFFGWESFGAQHLRSAAFHQYFERLYSAELDKVRTAEDDARPGSTAALYAQNRVLAQASWRKQYPKDKWVERKLKFDGMTARACKAKDCFTIDNVQVSADNKLESFDIAGVDASHLIVHSAGPIGVRNVLVSIVGGVYSPTTHLASVVLTVANHGNRGRILSYRTWLLASGSGEPAQGPARSLVLTNWQSRTSFVQVKASDNRPIISVWFQRARAKEFPVWLNT